MRLIDSLVIIAVSLAGYSAVAWFCAELFGYRVWILATGLLLLSLVGWRVIMDICWNGLWVLSERVKREHDQQLQSENGPASRVTTSYRR